AQAGSASLVLRDALGIGAVWAARTREPVRVRLQRVDGTAAPRADQRVDLAADLRGRWLAARPLGLGRLEPTEPHEVGVGQHAAATEVTSHRFGSRLEARRAEVAEAVAAPRDGVGAACAIP